MNGSDFLEIDGSFGEGGGAILRLSAGYSVLFNKPLRIKNIRANRPKPGLRLQHLLGLKALANLTNSKLSNCNVGTEEITFIPNIKSLKSKIHVKINTAASIGLLLQPIQIACLKLVQQDKINIILEGGGTFGKWAPSLNYLTNVIYQIFKRSGLTINIEIKKFGFYPKGGAQTNCTIIPPKNNLKPINLTNLGDVDLIKGEIVLTNHLKRNGNNIANRIKKSINMEIKKTLGIETDIKDVWVNSLSPGVGLCLWACSNTGAIVSTGTILGEKRLSSEKLGYIAAKEMIKYIQNEIPVDNYLSDQLIPLMAYVKAPSSIKVFEITSHTRTNLELIKLFTDKSYKILKYDNHYLIEY